VLRCVSVFCVTGAGESLLVCLALTRCRLRVTPFLLGGRCGNPLYTVLYIPGETLGPAWSGQQRRFDDVFLLEGAAWYEALQNTWSVVENTEGAGIAGHHCFVTSPLLSFLFLGHVFVVAPAFF
jgi:hypothetical protein